MPDPPEPLLLAVDGNSLLHRAYHAMGPEGLTDRRGRPIWALRGLISFVARAAARLTPDAVLVGFDCPVSSTRKAEYPLYKAHRPEKPAALLGQLAEAPELLAAAGFAVVVPPGYEADDVLASSAAAAAARGWRTVAVTSDRDAFALIDERTSVLRVMNGGIDGSPLITPEALVATYGVTAAQYRDFAALRGDGSDNLPGAHGIGATTAARLITAFGTLAEAYRALDEGRTEQLLATVGGPATERLGGADARARMARNQRLMSMRSDLDLPDPAAMRLPLDRRRVREVLVDREIYLGPSLWALTGGTPPPVDPPLPGPLEGWTASRPAGDHRWGPQRGGPRGEDRRGEVRKSTGRPAGGWGGRLPVRGVGRRGSRRIPVMVPGQLPLF
jgi:DNA polymerase-1